MSNVLASATVTLASIKDVASVTRYYLLKSSTASKPSVPTVNPPTGDWVKSEPTYTEGSTNSLYFVDLTVFSDDTFSYSDVSLSSSYEAAKTAYNIAQNAKNVADNTKETIDNLEVGGRNILLNSSFSSNFDKWVLQNKNDSVVTPEITVMDGFECCHYTGNINAYSHVKQNIIDRIINDNIEQKYVLSFDMKLVNFVAGETSPFLKVYFSGKYLNDGSSANLYATFIDCDPDISVYNNQGWVHLVFNIYFKKTPTNMICSIYSRDWSGDLYFKNMKMERGTKATDWSPAPEDVDDAIGYVSDSLEKYINSTEIVVGTQTAATGSWTGEAGFEELKDGQQIAYWLPYNGSGAATLNLTLSNGNVTGAIPVYYRGTTQATTHFVAGTIIHLTYRVNANVAGTNKTGWWADASYDSGNTNYYDRIRFNNNIKASSAITASCLIVSDDNGYFKLAANKAFDITKPILWASSAISSEKTGTNNYIAFHQCTLRNNLSGISLTQYQTCYLVGSLTGKTFTVKSDNFFTSTVPTSDDGYYYISLGHLYSTYQIYLYPEHPIYKFANGKFMSLNQLAYEANVSAIDTKNELDNLEVGGRNILLNSESKKIYLWNTAIENGATLTQEDGQTVSEWNTNSAIRAYGNAGSTSNLFGIIGYTSQNTDYYIANQSYTYSIYIKNQSENELEVVANALSASIVVVASGETKRVVLTGTGGANYYVQFLFRVSNASDTFDFFYWHPKIEYGNRVTDWSPAPEDLLESGNSVSLSSTSDNFINYTFNGEKTYYPDNIVITPFFSGNVTFDKWQYKLISSNTWNDVVSGNNGIVVSNNNLTLSSNSDLFSDSCTAVTFKCISNNSNFYSEKTIVREDDPTQVYNSLNTSVNQTNSKLSLIASDEELANYSASYTLNSKLSDISVSADEILMVVSQSVNNLSTSAGIKGLYNSATSYSVNNVVVLDGKFYKAKKASKGKKPPNTTYWTDVTSTYNSSKIKTAFSKIVALQDSITLTVSGSTGDSSTLKLSDGTMAISVTDVATILANKELNLTSQNGVINITGGGGVNIGTSENGAITINSPKFSLTKDGTINSTSGVIGGLTIQNNKLYTERRDNFRSVWIDGDNGSIYTGYVEFDDTKNEYYCTDKGIEITDNTLTFHNTWGDVSFLSGTIASTNTFSFTFEGCPIIGFSDNSSPLLTMYGITEYNTNRYIAVPRLKIDEFEGSKIVTSGSDGTLTEMSMGDMIINTSHYMENVSVTGNGYSDIEFDIGTNDNYTPIGIIATNIQNSSNVVLFGHYINEEQHKAKMRLRNVSSSTANVTCYVRVLWIRN